MIFFLNYFYPVLVGACGTRGDGNQPHALFEQRVRWLVMSKNEHPASHVILHRVLFLLGQRVVLHGGRFRDGGRLKVVYPFSLSFLCLAC